VAGASLGAAAVDRLRVSPAWAAADVSAIAAIKMIFRM
jgi:hypothetical protein